MKHDAQFQIVMKDLSHLNKIYLVPLADLHEGCRDADHEISDGYIQWIAETPDAYTIFNGDLLNCAIKDSTPELYEDLITPDKAYSNLLKRLLPIKSKVLMITRGGHEEHIFRKAGVDFMARLAYDLGDIPYRPEGGMFAVRLGLNNHTALFTGYATHGWGGARTAGAKVNKIEELAKIADVDLYILSHDHTQAVHRLNTLGFPKTMNWNKPNYMTTTRKLLVNTGGFVKYEGYIRRKGYAPQDLGTPRIRLELKKNNAEGYHKDLHSSI